MERSGASEITKADEAEGSETTVEIKVKTLDSQTYTLRVDKKMPVPALKAQIASVTGVLSEQQRLICRGKVLKDDQLLSAYHVEDGHTLHLVVRQPIAPSAEGISSQTASDPSSGAYHSSGTHISPSVVIETFTVPDHGDGVPPEIGRIVSAVLGSFGITNLGSGTEGRSERSSAGDSMLNSMLLQSESVGLRSPSSAFGLPTAISMGQSLVIPDALMTMSQCVIHMRGEFDNFVRGNGHTSQSAVSANTERRDSNFVQPTGALRDGLPTPASLAELVLSTRQLLSEQVGECLQLFAEQLENQANYTNPSTRSSTQNSAMRIGMLFHYLGAYILELGRTAMTLRLGQSPAETVVNAGPAIYISPLGPNPLMVQALPFHTGTSIGNIPVGTVHTSSSPGGGSGSGFLPRRIDVQIRRGLPTAVPNANTEGHGDRQQPVSAPRNITVNSTVTDSPSVRVQASIPRTANSNSPSADEPQNSQESGRQAPGSIYQILRSLFPGGEIHVEEDSGIGVHVVPDHAELGTTVNPLSDAREAEPEATMDGIFLSNLLHQIMPIISQHIAAPDSSSAQDCDSSFQVGGSSDAGINHRPSDTDMGPPNSKRQKRE